jgi:hypothetical protein
MKKKMKKFAEGGFSAAQEEWLGGADRTDPFILARMRKAVPDVAERKGITGPVEGLSGYGEQDEPEAIEKTVVKTKVTPSKKAAAVEEKTTEVKTGKKPYIDIPENAPIGMRQFRSDGVSPIETLFKRMSGTKSQRTTAAEKKMKTGGSVKSSASKRGDGCAVRGKTKGRMV